MATFRAHYLPFSPTEEAVDEGIRLLRGKGLLVKPVKQTAAENDNNSDSDASDASGSSDDDLVWHNNVLPSGAPTETIGFEPLCKISDCLENVSIEGRNANYCMKQRPYHPPKSSIWGGSQQMDGCCYEKEKLDAKSPLSMGNIGRIDEYKMKNTPKDVKEVRHSVFYRFSADL